MLSCCSPKAPGVWNHLLVRTLSSNIAEVVSKLFDGFFNRESISGFSIQVRASKTCLYTNLLPANTFRVSGFPAREVFRQGSSILARESYFDWGKLFQFRQKWGNQY